MVKHYIEVEKPFAENEVSEVSSTSCDCPAHVHDKEIPLELVEKGEQCQQIQKGEVPAEEDKSENVNYGYSSHFDF